jgi:hypothetical protein
MAPNFRCLQHNDSHESLQYQMKHHKPHPKPSHKILVLNELHANPRVTWTDQHLIEQIKTKRNYTKHDAILSHLFIHNKGYIFHPFNPTQNLMQTESYKFLNSFLFSPILS